MHLQCGTVPVPQPTKVIQKGSAAAASKSNCMEHTFEIHHYSIYELGCRIWLCAEF